MVRVISTLVSMAVIWGSLAVFMAVLQWFWISLPFMIICMIFGWKVLTCIDSQFFMWMSCAGWIAYFVLKGILSFFIGVFVAPFGIGKFIAERVGK